jgi:hypothetical protein
MAVRSALRAGLPLPPRNLPGTHFCQRPSRPQGHSKAGRVRLIEKSNDLIGIRTRYLPACSIVLQPTTLPRAPILKLILGKQDGLVWIALIWLWIETSEGLL